MAKKYSELIQRIDEIFSYFNYHNKNLTKTQYFKILELQDLIHEMRLTEAQK